MSMILKLFTFEPGFFECVTGSPKQCMSLTVKVTVKLTLGNELLHPDTDIPADFGLTKLLK